MYTVGLISKSTLKTYSYSDFNYAKNKFEQWWEFYKLHHNVNYSTTIIDRNNIDSIISMKTIFNIDDDSEVYTIFLSKDIEPS